MQNDRFRRRLLFVAVVTVATLTPDRWWAQPKPVTAEQVLRAIDRGVAYLKREQGPRGNWNDVASFPGGVSSLVTLALLNAGVPTDDPTITKALEYLRKLKPKKTYTVALQTMAFCAAEPKRDLLAIQRNVRWLEESQVRDGDRAGAWSYEGVRNTGGDNSNAQFAVLALYEAQLVGAKVNPTTWQLALDYWQRTQNADGSWGYFPDDPRSGSMTCAGIGGLVTCSAAIAEGDAQVKDGQILCCQKAETNDAMEKALAWFGRNFTVQRNPRSPGTASQPCLYYYLYGMERTGRLTARRFIGEHDWYREGAEFLVYEQDRLSHYWKGDWAFESREHVSTSMALLFLAKGRRPVVIAKLQYGEDDRWNLHRNDAANITSYTEQAWELGLTWQVYDPASASVDDLLQAPVLYISGNSAPDLLPHAVKLRDYVDRGGFLFAEACCSNSSAFDKGIRELMAAVFPEPEYQLQQLGPSHPVWRMEQLVASDSPYLGNLWGVEYGCRTSVIYSAEDLSCFWELARPGRWTQYPESVQQKIQDGLTVGLNVLTYATGREPKGKEQSFMVPLADTEGDALGDRGIIEIVKLRHGGGCDDAPGALINLLRTASQGDLKLRLRTSARLVDIDTDQLAQHHLAFMHGRHDFRLTPAEQRALATFLERGGTLLADSICASKAFTQAFRREMQEALPEHTLEAIPADDPIFSSTFGGYDVQKVSVRDPVPTQENQPVAARVRESVPQLEGIKLGDRWAVIFSPLDISCALEQHESVQCRGYTQKDAARMALNVLAYSLNQ